MALKKFIVIHSELHFVATVCLLSGRCQLKCKSEQVFEIRYTVAYALQLEFGKYLLLSYTHTEMRYSKIASKDFWDRSRALVATWLRLLHPIFGCPYMHLLRQLTVNLHERRLAEQQVGDGC